MNVPQAQLDLILNPKMRQRTLTLPVRRGKAGELKRCPMRQGGVYNLRASVPYDRHLSKAREQPTRSRSVLKLIDLCEIPKRTVLVTVLRVERLGDEWHVKFVRGDTSANIDRPVFLAKYADYTLVASKQSVPRDPEVMMPLAEDLARARAKARERRFSPQEEGVARMRREVDGLLGSMTAMKQRNRLKRIARELELIGSQLSVETSDTVHGSQRAEYPVPVAGQDVARSNGISPVVCLEPAA